MVKVAIVPTGKESWYDLSVVKDMRAQRGIFDNHGLPFFSLISLNSSNIATKTKKNQMSNNQEETKVTQQSEEEEAGQIVTRKLEECLSMLSSIVLCLMVAPFTILARCCKNLTGKQEQ